MSLEKALFDLRKACQNLGIAIGAAYRRFVADIGRRAGRRDPVVGFDLGAPSGDVTVMGRFKADEIAKFFGVPPSRGISKRPRDSVFFAPIDLLIQPQGDKYAQDYASRVNVEAWNQCRRFGREPNNARASVTRHIHKLTRYSQRALTGRG